MSLPSRLRIRPVGVLSKNDIGLRRTHSSVPWKRRIEAYIVPLARYIAIANIAKPITIGDDLDLLNKMTVTYIHVKECGIFDWTVIVIGYQFQANKLTD